MSLHSGTGSGYRSLHAGDRGADHAAGAGAGAAVGSGWRLRSAIQTLPILPFAMSPALIGVSFRFMFNPEFKLFDAFFGVIFPPLADVSWLADPGLAMAVCIMADVWGWIPF